RAEDSTVNEKAQSRSTAPSLEPARTVRLKADPTSSVHSYGSTRTIVGFGSPAVPPYATEPRYFVPAVNPLNVRLIVPVAPFVAAAGALTVMLPALVVPSNQ